MKKVSLILIALVVLLTSALPLRADTVGFIDVQKVFTGYAETRKAQSQLEDKETKYKTAFEEKQKKIQELKDKNTAEDEIKKKIDAFEKDLDPLKKDLLALNTLLSTKLQQDIVKAVQAVAKELQIDIIVDKQVIITGGIDISDLVVTRLNSK